MGSVFHRTFPSTGAPVPVIGPYICYMAENQLFTVVQWEPEHGIRLPQHPLGSSDFQIVLGRSQVTKAWGY